MTSVLVLIALIAGLAWLVHLTRNDRFSGPLPLDRFRDADGFLVSGISRNIRL